MFNSCDPMDCSPPSSSVHGILQARIMEWVAISFSRGSSWPRSRTQVSCIAGRFFTNWAMREAPHTVWFQLKFWKMNHNNRDRMNIAWKWGRLEGVGGRDWKKPQGKLWSWLNVYNIFVAVIVSQVYTHIASYQSKMCRFLHVSYIPQKIFKKKKL